MLSKSHIIGAENMPNSHEGARIDFGTYQHRHPAFSAIHLEMLAESINGGTTLTNGHVM